MIDVSSDYSSGFLLGFVSAVSIFLLHKLVRTAYTCIVWVDLDKVESIATKAVPHKGDDDKITIFGFWNKGEYPCYHKGIADTSPFSSRVENFCRLHNIPFEKKAANAHENPRNKIPFANLQGVMVDDSARIIKALREKFSIEKEELKWSKDQMVQAHLIRQMVFENIYWVECHLMFETKKGREAFANLAKPIFPPFPLNHFILSYIFRSSSMNTYRHGIGRRPHQEIVQIAKDTLRTLSHLLGKSKFYLQSEEPTSLDTDIYSFVVSILYDDLFSINGWVKELKMELENLVAYVARMKRILYPAIISKENCVSSHGTMLVDSKVKAQ